MADDTLRQPRIDEWPQPDLYYMSAEEKDHGPLLPVGAGYSSNELSKITGRQYVGETGQKRGERTVGTRW
jgi:hypothetical protein